VGWGSRGWRSGSLFDLIWYACLAVGWASGVMDYGDGYPILNIFKVRSGWADRTARA
jgi:hypothetical protein